VVRGIVLILEMKQSAGDPCRPTANGADFPRRLRSKVIGAEIEDEVGH
jgi:hypothetical protein